ncbi:MAG: 3-dehydroquinate synthase [uncultured bacterium]|nr:MAG: 3-dehydroquinate synthase [uncultured bacterium]
MRLTLKTSTQQYPIIVALNSVKKFAFPATAIVVADAALAKLARRTFPGRRIILLPVGEACKRLSTVETLCEKLVRIGVDRKASLVAFGGGVLGDIVGFTASVYMRGIKYYHVPTTLLAMVDSSIGGKTGVDLASGKNLVGRIYQPQAVIMDPNILRTLPPKEFANGLAEVVKHGVLYQPLFLWLEKNVSAIQRRRPAALQQLIARSVVVKVGIVEMDEHENQERMLLNLGHTFGHAIEKVSHYQIPHGQAVAYGLALISAYAKMPERARLLFLLEQFGLQIEPPRQFMRAALLQAMLVDKKRSGSNITLVLPKTLGQIVICSSVQPKIIERFLRNYQA